MPINIPTPLRWIDQQEFAALDYQIMQQAFSCQNKRGRLCDEIIYRNDLAARLRAANVGPVETEAPVVVSHGGFSKTYYLDLVVNRCAVYELKVASQLAPEHEAQLLNYILLHGLAHGKLVNFRSPKLESRFVNTSLTPKTRRQMAVDATRWKQCSSRCRELRLALIGLLQDWGGFLELSLYSEALIHLLGGGASVVREVPLTRDGLELGRQRFNLLERDTAFRVTSFPQNEALEMERHLTSLLRLTPLRVIQWINIFRHQAHLVSLTK